MRLAEERFLVANLGDALAVFDCRTWESHLLPAQAAVLLEIAQELKEQSGNVSEAGLEHALRSEYKIDLDALSLRQFLGTLREIGMLDE